MPRPTPPAARTTPSALFDGLNDRQLEAVAAPDGALLVIAGPGSGKTRVICQAASLPTAKLWRSLCRLPPGVPTHRR